MNSRNSWFYWMNCCFDSMFFMLSFFFSLNKLVKSTRRFFYESSFIKKHEKLVPHKLFPFFFNLCSVLHSLWKKEFHIWCAVFFLMMLTPLVWLVKLFLFGSSFSSRTKKTNQSILFTHNAHFTVQNGFYLND